MHFTARIFILSFCFFCFLSFTTSVSAIDVTFSPPPSELDVTDTFTTEVSVSGASNDSSYYIRGSFFHKDSPSSYFGYTKNNEGNWHNTPSEFTSYYKVTGNGTWDIEFKPNTTASGYKGSGEYQFKIARYTENGSLSWSDQIEPIQLIEPSTPSPTPTPTLQPTPAPNIQLSEVMACAEKGTYEWVELKNMSNFSAELTDWSIHDSKSYSKTFSANIASNGYTTIDVSNLNNSGDSVELFNQEGQQVDSMSYAACSTTTSWINSNGSWQQTTTITKNGGNTLTTPTPTPEPTPKPTDTPTPTPTSKPTATPKPSPTATDTTTDPTSITQPKNPAGTPNSSGFTLPALDDSGQILGAKTDNIDFPSSYATTAATTNSSAGNPGGIISLLIGSGLLIGIGGYFGKEWYNKHITTEG